VLAAYDIGKYSCVYAYGDTPEDEQMLSIAHKKFFRWKEVVDAGAARASPLLPYLR